MPDETLKPWDQIEDKIAHNLTTIPREELEHKLLQALQKLHEGLRLMESAQQAIQWLAETAIMLGTELKFQEPRLAESVEELITKAKKMSGIVS